MEYPLAELIDRLTILDLKCARTPPDPATRAAAARLRDAAFARFGNPDRVLGWYHDLIDINGRIWDLEADIRRGREGELGLEEVGRRALAIREINAERVQIKAEIARAAGDFAEGKADHASGRST